MYYFYCYYLVFFLTPFTSKATNKKVTISHKKIVLNNGESFQLKINGTKSKVKWSTDKKDILKVSKNGKITAIKGGFAYVYAKVDNKEYTCRVSVMKPVINSSAYKRNETKPVKLKIYNQSISHTLKDVKWSSSNPEIATVDKNGMLTGKSSGKVTITATYGKQKISGDIYILKESIRNPISFS